MRVFSSRNSFLEHLGGSKDAKSIEKRVQMMLRMKKVKMLIFDTPPLQNQCLWVAMEVKMEPK